MKKLLPLALVLVLFLSACGNSSSQGSAKTVHNVKLGIDVSLGMKKTEIDKLLGDPVASDTCYSYLDAGLAASYTEGKAVMLIVSDSQWEGIGGVRVSNPASILTEQFGESYSPDSNTYLFDKKSGITGEKENAATIAMFKVTDETIESFTLVDYTPFNE